MLAGRVPFQGDASDVLRRHIMEDLPLATAMPKGVPAGVIAVLRTATAKTRTGRFADAKEMREELDRVAPAPGEGAPAPAPAPAARADAFAPTLSIEQKPTEPAPVEERVTAPDPAPAAAPVKSLGQRVLRFGTTVAILVSLTAAGLAAAAIYMLVTPGREEERRAIEDALGLPSASASSAFHPKTLRSKEAWPAGIAESAEPPTKAVRGESPPVDLPAEGPPGGSAEATEPAPDVPATTPEPAPAPAGSEGALATAVLEAKPKGPVPENPWASTPGELLRLMGRANKTRGFDKRDMRDLHQYNGKHPTDPRGHILLARGYLTRRWVKDAATEYATALKISDSTRGDPRLLPDLIRIVQLGSDEATRLVVEVFGPTAGPAVDRALASQARPEVKARLEKLREELGK
jgi:hypothetical protein